jgi:glycosyltransferase involved in cell wall biosynthesis
MKVGIVTYYVYDPIHSISHVRATTMSALKGDHELIPYPREFAVASPQRREELLREWLVNCDVLLGGHDGLLLRARAAMTRPTPFVCLLMGGLTEGGWRFAGDHRRMYTSDVLVGNCEADAIVARNFFPNATIAMVPFPYDETIYYPTDDAERRAVREGLGIGVDDPMLLYVGRITLEKNLHTVLKAFRVVLDAVPTARLVIAGGEVRISFPELGTYPLAIKRTLERLIAHFELGDRVHFVGHRSPTELRGLYSAADVLVNLTLHHGENFGLAQIEAMACGCPVVGTTWGGLKDTVVNGVTGEQVPAVFTPAGIKVDWWRAANAIVDLLGRTDANRARRARCAETARDRYSIRQYGAALNRVLAQTVDHAQRPCAALQASPFAERFWAMSATPLDGGQRKAARPAYRRGPEAWELYRELITPFSGTTPNGSATAVPSAWCLAAPLAMQEDDALAVNDPLFPFPVPVPPTLVDSVRGVIGQFAMRPVLTHATLLQHSGEAVADTLAWMEGQGLLLRTELGSVDLSCARGVLGQPVFVIREVDSRSDIVRIW